jgi:hypothetical protein
VGIEFAGHVAHEHPPEGREFQSRLGKREGEQAVALQPTQRRQLRREGLGEDDAEALLDGGEIQAADVRLGQRTIDLPSLGEARVPLIITVEQCTLSPALTFTAVATNDAGTTRRQPIRFVAPPGRPGCPGVR